MDGRKASSLVGRQPMPQKELLLQRPVLHSSNHALAPISAAFVKEFREVFGDVKVLYVRENGVELGKLE
jgi:hypothetical protein